ncbi:MAG: AAA family ATPase [Candidatus Thiodiazotropha sp. (ex Dulcina madagascariensis)]|nr:AAA family ATPase [Candidatus Thiodiazotropha sp. (ex Dulcina madagascariensis)]MCU7925076.1 AAA family ATPase [Candidatus Thiodiazotropha sp. (ex Dulcina madagascariensis)]
MTVSESPLQADVYRLTPKPTCLADTALSPWLLADLACKHLAESSVLDMGELAGRLTLPGMVVEELLRLLRAQGRVELSGQRGNSPLLRFNLTQRGRTSVAEALQREGYVGPAPITREHYERVLTTQSPRRFPLTYSQFEALFADTVIDPALIGRLGPAIHSGRAIFIYGQPGTGKSFIARRLKRAIGPPILLPYALVVGDNIIRIFDPGVHYPLKRDAVQQSPRLQQGVDPRFIWCERPVVVGAGELTLEMLDLQYNSSKRVYTAPLQLKANGGLLIIDDLGRQRIPPESLLNRWILPMEERCDLLSLNSGERFSVPFELTLIFSTNFEPTTLADEAFLRRIGYKVRFQASTLAEYEKIWRQSCAQFAIEFDRDCLDFVTGELYTEHRMPMLPCHPRDLLQLAMDYRRYMGGGPIDRESLCWAWQNYFLEV